MGDKKKVEKQEKRTRQVVESTRRPTKAPQRQPLPQTRAELMDLHRETRARRNRAAHGSEEHVAAIELIGRIEIEIARIERAVDPPLV